MLYTIARQGQASPQLEVPGKDLEPLFEAILTHISAAARRRTQEPLQLLVANLDYDDYVGRLAMGRVQAGRLTPNMPVAVMREGGKVQQGKVVKLYGFQGLKRTEIADAGPGEIVSIAGIEDISIGDTIADPEQPVALPRITVDEPTMMMIFKVNDGPLAGKEGKYVTSRNLRERLYREAYRNVSIRVEDTETPDAFRVVGRGELQLAVIIETMRREGYELTASNPEPVTKTIDGVLHEPMELLFCDVPETQRRRGHRAAGRPQGPHDGHGAAWAAAAPALQFRIPARGLIGFRSEFLTITRGEGIMSSQFDGYEPWFGYIPKRSNGAIVSDRLGETVPYALFSIQERGYLFVGAGVTSLRGDDHRRARAPLRPQRQRVPREEAHQHPRRRPRRERHPHPAPRDGAGEGARVDRRRRAGRGDAQVGAHAQEVAQLRRALPRRPRPQARGARRGLTPHPLGAGPPQSRTHRAPSPHCTSSSSPWRVSTVPGVPFKSKG